MRRQIMMMVVMVVCGMSLTACQSVSAQRADDDEVSCAETRACGDDSAPRVAVVVEEEAPYDEEVVYEESRPSRVVVAARSGYTACGTFFASHGEKNQCQPGSWCADATFSKCAPGCLSDQNCSGEQVCVKGAGQNLGTCQAY